MRQPLYLIDASIFIFRAYFSLPDVWHSVNGSSVNAVYGYTCFLIDFIEKQRPIQVVAAFDESLGQCFRNSLYPGYKSTRVLPDAELAFQLEACKRITQCLEITTVARRRYEADDINASYAALANARGQPVTILTRDKDLGQLLVTDDDRWWDFGNAAAVARRGFITQFGVKPEQFADYLALVGDRIDDIPGVPSVGAKTAAALLVEYGSIQALYQRLETVAALPLRGAQSLVEELRLHQDQVMLSRQLTTLATHIPNLRPLDRLQWQMPKRKRVQKLIEQLGLRRALKQRLRESPVLQD